MMQMLGLGILAAIAAMVIRSQRPEMAVALSITAGVCILLMALSRVGAIVEMMNMLSQKAMMDDELFKTILKMVGIGVLTEFAVQLCMDAGEGGIAKKLEFGGKIVMLSMSVPIFSALAELIIALTP